jgi:hypothetical protein
MGGYSIFLLNLIYFNNFIDKLHIFPLAYHLKRNDKGIK